MADFSISGRMKVKTLKANFKKEFGGTLRVYHGLKFADDDATLASIASKKIDPTTEFKVNGNTKTSNFESKFKDVFGIKVKVANKDDTTLVGDDITLSGSGRI